MAHMFLLQYALMYGPVYFGKASFKITEELMKKSEDSDSEIVYIGFFFALYLAMSTALGAVIEEVAGWVLDNSVLVQRFKLLVLLVEEIFCQALFPTASTFTQRADSIGLWDKAYNTLHPPPPTRHCMLHACRKSLSLTPCLFHAPPSAQLRWAKCSSCC